MNNTLRKTRTVTAFAVAAIVSFASPTGTTAAESATPTPKPTQAVDWPPADQVEPIAGAISAILTTSAKPTEDVFRKQLVTSSTAAKNAVQSQLDKCYGVGKIKLPDALLVLFYLPLFPGVDGCAHSSNEAKALSITSTDGLALVFDLPPVDGQTHFYYKHLRCCYPVWLTPATPCAATSASPTP